VEVEKRGAHSTVFRMCDRSKGRQFALKTVKVSDLSDSDRKTITKELDFLDRIRHSRIVEVEKAVFNNTGFDIHMEFLPLETLQNYINAGASHRDLLCPFHRSDS